MSVNKFFSLFSTVIPSKIQMVRNSGLIKTMSLLLQELVLYVTNFIQLVSSQPVDQFSQTKLLCKALNKGYLQICGMYKSDNK